MEEKLKLIESLLQSALKYGITSFELLKLKTADKTSEVVSNLIPRSLIFGILAFSMFFLSVGLAIWLGEIFGIIYIGFFIVAAFYAVAALLMQLFMRKWLQKKINNYIVNQLFK